MEHTKEPWSLPHFAEKDSGCQCGYIFGGDGEYTIAEVFFDKGDDPYHQHPPKIEAVLNARHIVACVNACAGMEDPAVELSSLRAALAEKTAQVERLREALTNVHDYGIDRDGETTSEKLGELVDELVQLSREAIAATAPKET